MSRSTGVGSLHLDDSGRTAFPRCPSQLPSGSGRFAIEVFATVQIVIGADSAGAGHTIGHVVPIQEYDGVVSHGLDHRGEQEAHVLAVAGAVDEGSADDCQKDQGQIQMAFFPVRRSDRTVRRDIGCAHPLKGRTIRLRRVRARPCFIPVAKRSAMRSEPFLAIQLPAAVCALAAHHTGDHVPG